MKSGSWSLWLELSVALLITLVVSNALTLAVFWRAWAGNVHKEGREAIEDRLTALVPLLLTLPDNQWQQLSRAASKKTETFSIDTRPSVRLDARRNADAEESLFRAISSVGGNSVVRQVRVSQRIRAAVGMLGNKKRRGYVGMDIAVPLPDGRWLNARFRWPDEDGLIPGLLTSICVSGLAMCLMSWWLARRLGVPMQQIANASLVMQTGRPVMPLAARGPSAFRQAVQAFNEMSQRVMPLVDGQRVVLASVGHDLRSPITSLRIKSELIEDEELRQSFAGSLDELQSMTEAALEAARSGLSGEDMRSVDLTALVDGICDDLHAHGHDVSSAALAPVVVSCRPQEVKRAVRNLVENAIKYGRQARVSVCRNNGLVTVVVDDDGPGIPPADLQRVFEPFVRLVASGAAREQGHGLGLAITRTIARAHGGDVVMSNRPEGGLRAELTLRG